MLGRPHPAPTITGARGNPKLSAWFTEWMMCAPHGWIGDLVDDGTITNNAGLKLSGNGVVIPQAVHAIRGMLARAFSSMTTQPELIETCHDCGDPSLTPICDECAEVAELFGLTPEQRLAQIGGVA